MKDFLTFLFMMVVFMAGSVLIILISAGVSTLLPWWVALTVGALLTFSFGWFLANPIADWFDKLIGNL